MNPYQRIQEKFKCPKCHNQASVCKEVKLSKVSEKILGLHSNKYLLVSCSLCGYTETYNLRIIVQSDQEETVSNAVLQPRPQDE